MQNSRVLAVVVNYNGGAHVVDAVASLTKQSVPVAIVLVDNASRDGSDVEISQRFPNVAVRRMNSNVGFAAACNTALDTVAEYYFFLNPDAVAHEADVEKLCAIMDASPQLGALGATLVDYESPSKVQSFAPRLDLLAFPVDEFSGASVSALPGVAWVPSAYASGAAIIVRAGAFREAGGMDADFFLFTEETDLCWRLRLFGWEVGVTPQVRIRHVGGAIATAGMREGRYHTSIDRIYLRERNCMMMCIKCYALPTLALYAGLNTGALLAETLALLLLRRFPVAAAYARAVRDVWRARSSLLRKRRAVQQGRRVSEFAILKRWYAGYGKLRMLVRVGMPAVAESRAKSSLSQ